MILILWITMHCMISIAAESEDSVPSMVADDHDDDDHEQISFALLGCSLLSTLSISFFSPPYIKFNFRC